MKKTLYSLMLNEEVVREVEQCGSELPCARVEQCEADGEPASGIGILGVWELSGHHGSLRGGGQTRLRITLARPRRNGKGEVLGEAR